MNCKDVELLIADYLGDELEDSLRDEVLAHLQECSECSAIIEDLQQTVETMRKLETVSHQDATVQVDRLHVVRDEPHAIRWARSLVKVAAILALGVVLGRYWPAGSPETKVVEKEAEGAVKVVQVECSQSVHPSWIRFSREAGAGNSSYARNLAAMLGPGARQ